MGYNRKENNFFKNSHHFLMISFNFDSFYQPKSKATHVLEK